MNIEHSDNYQAIVTHQVASTDLFFYEKWIKSIHAMVQNPTAQMEHDLIAPANNTQRPKHQ